MADGQSDHLAEHGLRLLGHRGPMLGFDGAEMAIDESDGRLAYPNAAKRRQKFACRDGRGRRRRWWGAVLTAEVDEPRLGDSGQPGVRRDLGGCVDAGPVPQRLGQGPLGRGFRSADALDLADDAVVVADLAAGAELIAFGVGAELPWQPRESEGRPIP